MSKNILVAPLNWGLGHATRCIPIIRALAEHGFNPIIASDGMALSLLQKEFPELEYEELPSYGIRYPVNGNQFKFSLLRQTGKILKAIKKEQELTECLIETYRFCGIISDNRFGVRSDSTPSAYITHQLKVKSGSSTWLSTKAHEYYINKFDECWVPDHEDSTNLSGDLSQGTVLKTKLKYIGTLSRFESIETTKKYDVLVLLSGPEPQRTILEKQLLADVHEMNKKILFVRGVVETEQKVIHEKDIEIVNFMTSKQLEIAINESELIISRSGYTTIMDLAKLKKKAFFIPTPGQFEQEYLADYLSKTKRAASCTQNDFNLEELNRVNSYLHLSTEETEINYQNLFGLFEGK